jgi:ketosteroid isomerase-like protein
VISQENVDRVVTAVDAINNADVEAFVACFHPDVEWVVTQASKPSGCWSKPSLSA